MTMLKELFSENDIQAIMPYQDPDNNDGTTPSEFEELKDGNDIRPNEYPDEEVDYPQEDEILDDDPLTEIDEPSKREFDQELPSRENDPEYVPQPDRKDGVGEDHNHAF
jgi:phage-related protein